MDASAYRGILPPTLGPARDLAILAAGGAGDLWVPAWRTIEYQAGGHRVRATVSTDAVHLGEPGDSVRINASQPTGDKIAALFDAVQPTGLLWDQAFLAADVRLMPVLLGASSSMGSTAWMFQHSELVDHQLAGAAYAEGTMFANWGKAWVNTRKLWWPEASRSRVANYGWGWRPEMGPAQSTRYPSQTGAFDVYQPIGIAHWYRQGPAIIAYSDYSQCIGPLVRRQIEIDVGNGWEPRDIDSVSTHDDLCRLVSNEGPIPMRHPETDCGPTSLWESCYVPPATMPPGGALPPAGGSAARARAVRLAATAVALGAAGAAAAAFYAGGAR